MRHGRNPWIGLAILFAGSLAAGRWLLDFVVVLQYDTPASFFIFDRAFLSQWLDRPGGLLAYADRFLRQFFFSAWLGALVIALWTSVLGLLVHHLRQQRGEETGVFHTLAPCLSLLIVEVQSPYALGLIASCAAYAGYLSLRGKGARLAWAALVTPVLYFAVGGFCWFFVLWVLVARWPAWSPPAGRVLRLAFLALAVCLPLAAYRWLFPISLGSAWLDPLRLPETATDGLLLAYLVAIPMWPALRWPRGLQTQWGSRRGIALQWALLVGLMGSLLLLSYDPSARRLADYHRLYKQGDWRAILARAHTHPLPDGMGQFFVNYALYRNGSLLDEMFAYPQQWGTEGLLPSLSDHGAYGRRAMYKSDLYMEMGHVNAAYKLAYNHVYVWGETYANLRRLAECAMVNGNYALAGKYLRRLASTLSHREYARRYQQFIAAPDSAARYFSSWREKRPTVELEIGLGDFACLLSLVKSRPDNRMALDYLTAWCLLDKGALPLVAASISRLTAAGHAALPTHCQEALMLWESTTRTRMDRGGYQIDGETAARFQRFGQAMRRAGSKEAAVIALRREFHDTYTYYYLFSRTPPDPTAWSSWLMLGNELLALGEVDEAISYYRQAELRQPSSALVQTHLARALAQGGQSEQAGEHFRRARAGDSAAARQAEGRAWHMGTH